MLKTVIVELPGGEFCSWCPFFHEHENDQLGQISFCSWYEKSIDNKVWKDGTSYNATNVKKLEQCVEGLKK